MKRREKILAAVAAVLLLSWLGYSRAGSGAGGALSKLDREIARLRAKRDRLKSFVAQQPSMLAEWDNIGRRTLAADEQGARRLFDAQIKQLIRDSHLTQVSVGSASFRGKRGRVHTLIVPITVEGKQKDVVDFLRRFYKLPFVAQIRNMTLAPAGKKKSKELRMTAKLETLVLPETKLGGKVLPWDAARAAETDPPVRFAVAEDLLNKIWEKNIFEPYKPKPKPRPQPPRSQDRPKRTTKPPAPRKPKDRGIITALLAGPGRCEIRTRDGQKTKTYELGDKVAGGELVFVHPYGAVIRIGGREYLYPIGAALADEKDRYDIEAVPAVRETLQRLRAQPQPEDDGPEGAGD